MKPMNGLLKFGLLRSTLPPVECNGYNYISVVIVLDLLRLKKSLSLELCICEPVDHRCDVGTSAVTIVTIGQRDLR